MPVSTQSVLARLSHGTVKEVEPDRLYEIGWSPQRDRNELKLLVRMFPPDLLFSIEGATPLTQEKFDLNIQNAVFGAIFDQYMPKERGQHPISELETHMTLWWDAYIKACDAYFFLMKDVAINRLPVLREAIDNLVSTVCWLKIGVLAFAALSIGLIYILLLISRR